MDSAEFDRSANDEHDRREAEQEQAEQRWEKKNGHVGLLARLYLMHKPSAVAMKRLTAQRAIEIEHVLAWSFMEYSEAEMDSLCEEISRFGRMRDIDHQLMRVLSPQQWMFDEPDSNRPQPSP